ncbi:hypothetical protein FJT64_008889 [Amphibalanus amphitrite]|uniref:C-type lectin domain-containing protein n=1 Tax=Amphibalanus amphitrite TaxID=1232801 RepID=A0A6A4VV08_AMPAM|nr:hypothetical protein FJT64_008889 [Amphibalanus amphitrite]
MSLLAPLRLLWCAAAVSGTLYLRQPPVGDTAGSELAQLTTGNPLLCGMHCNIAGSGCVGFHHTGSTCRLFSALYAGLDGTFVRQLRPVPAGYSACGRTAYRILPPMGRDLAKAACAQQPGGRMAIPITAEERNCVSQLGAEANAIPGFNPANLDYPHVLYIGVLVHGPAPAYTYTDLENNPLELPADVWEAGQPNDNRDLAYTTLVNGLYTDWHTWGILMNVCELGLFE